MITCTLFIAIFTLPDFLSLINLFSKYAAIDQNSLYLYCGIPPFKKEIELPWEKIVKAEVLDYQRMVSGGGLMPNFKGDYRGIQIDLKAPISEIDRKIINKNEGRHLFDLGMEVSGSGKSLLIRESPHTGFKTFIESFPVKGKLPDNLTIVQRVSKQLIIFNAANLIIFVFWFTEIINK